MAHSMFPLHSTGLDYESYSGAWREENEFSIYYFYSFYSYWTTFFIYPSSVPDPTQSAFTAFWVEKGQESEVAQSDSLRPHGL